MLLKNQNISRFEITFDIKQLYCNWYCQLIDACNFAKCVNWNAAYDPKKNITTNIPLYWIFIDLQFDLPCAYQSMESYEYRTQLPIACYGVTDVPVLKIKDWFKVSPYYSLSIDVKYDVCWIMCACECLFVCLVEKTMGGG